MNATPLLMLLIYGFYEGCLKSIETQSGATASGSANLATYPPSRYLFSHDFIWIKRFFDFRKAFVSICSNAVFSNKKIKLLKIKVTM